MASWASAGVIRAEWEEIRAVVKMEEFWPVRLRGWAIH
jgi:hypothetical protein